MRWVSDMLEAARQAAALLVLSRMFALLLVVCALGSVAFGFVAQEAALNGSGTQFFGFAAYLLFFQFGLPFAVMYFGVVAVHDEIADRTATYLFVRPVGRSSLLVGKWLSVVAVGGMVCSAALAWLFLALALPDHPWRLGVRPSPAMLASFVLAGAMAVAAYAAVGVCFGTLFRRPLISGIAFVIGWEFLVSHAPPRAGIRELTVADPIRRWLLRDLQPSGELAELLQRGLDPKWLAAGGLTEPVVSLASFTGVMLVAGLWFYTRRDYAGRAAE